MSPLVIQDNVPLKTLNSLQMSASARWFCKARSRDDVLQAAEFAKSKSLPIVPLGGGTNMVFLNDLDAVVVSIGIQGIEFSGTEVAVGAGENWHRFVGTTLDQGLYGLENLALIPGTVGAAPVQNIGAYGVELDSRFRELVAIHTPTLKTQTLSKDDCLFDYRTSRFKQEEGWLITEVRFNLSKTESTVTDYPGIEDYLSANNLPATSRHVFQAVTAIRQSKLPDPEVEPNAGSFFRNPTISQDKARELQLRFPQLPIFPARHNKDCKLSAAWLIDNAGLKGQAVGPIEVSRRHALVLVNKGGGTGDQLLKLVSSIQSRVEDFYGVQLEPEPRFIPDPP